MQNSPTLFVEINNFEYIFIVGYNNEDNKFSLLYSKKVPQEGIINKRVNDLNLVSKIIKENIYLIEKTIDHVFKEVILIIDSFDCSLVSFSGFKKLNGTQLDKDNVTYILNDLKSRLLETEEGKTILHIFNLNYLLDKKKINNVPIGLFGNFYSHELSFFLIDSNDYKNLQNIFAASNLRIKKILSKNFILGTQIINSNPELQNFVKIEINEDNIDLSIFENSTFKFFQKFEFGSNLILKDISKVTALKYQTVKNILLKSNFSEDNEKNNFLEDEFLENQYSRKIKKQLICDIASARIEELAEIILYKNINLKGFLQKNFKIFLKISDTSNIKCFENIFINFFSNNEYELNFLENYIQEEVYENTYNIAQYGWKKEAVPIVREKKSIIKRFFELFFN